MDFRLKRDSNILIYRKAWTGDGGSFKISSFMNILPSSNENIKILCDILGN